MWLFATVTRGYDAVVGAKVVASIENPAAENYTKIELKMRDDGLGADMAKEDGTYSAYIVNSKSIGKHAIFVDSWASVSVPFGKIYYPGEADRKWHSGVDIKAKKGTVLHSPAEAKVLWTGKKDGYGYTVDIELKDGRKMRFSSLYKILVEKGDALKPGDLIGKVGSSAKDSTGPHLHLEVYHDGEHQDPLDVKGLVIFEECCDS